MEVLILAVKPQDLDSALREIASLIDKKTLVISIAAGRKLDWIESRLPSARVIRVMPNLPCQVSEGMSVYCLGTQAKPVDAQTAETLLAGFGKVLALPESKFDAVTAISGSGPAFFTRFLEAIIAAGVEEGLSRDDALLLARQTMLGTSRLLVETRQDPRHLIDSVASARGTTAAGLTIFDSGDLDKIVAEAIQAAAQRSRELSEA